MAGLIRPVGELEDQVALKVHEALTHLGDTALEVFENLLALKCYGETAAADACPVWQVLDRLALDKFIAEQVATDVDYVDFSVSSGGIVVDFEYLNEYRSVVVYPPAPVEEFIIDFDAGIYPQLDLEND